MLCIFLTVHGVGCAVAGVKWGQCAHCTLVQKRWIWDVKGSTDLEHSYFYSITWREPQEGAPIPHLDQRWQECTQHFAWAMFTLMLYAALIFIRWDLFWRRISQVQYSWRLGQMSLFFPSFSFLFFFFEMEEVGSPVSYRIFSSIPGLYSLRDRKIPSTYLQWDTKTHF